MKFLSLMTCGAVVCLLVFSQASNAAVVNTDILNADSNGAGDEAPGETDATSFSISSAVGDDNPADAFGNNDGTIEPNTFIFGDGGVVDNGNDIFGDGGETVDFIEWHTNSPIQLGGLNIELGGDALVDGANRSTELIRVLVEGVEVALFDNNGAAAFPTGVDIIFPSVIGDDFRVEFTRTTEPGGRIFEINALDASVVPEPASLMLLGMGVCLTVCRRQRIA